MSTNNYDDMPQRLEDPRDATIRQLRSALEGVLDALDGDWSEGVITGEFSAEFVGAEKVALDLLARLESEEEKP